MIERSPDMGRATPRHLCDIPGIPPLVLPLPAEPCSVVELRVNLPIQTGNASGDDVREYMTHLKLVL